jgi:hypothetical protein
MIRPSLREYTQVRLRISIAAVSAANCLAASCSGLQPLSEPCGPGTTLVSPRGEGLEVIERAADVLWWDESRPLWALQGRTSTSTASLVEASFLAEFQTCSRGRPEAPTTSQESAALGLFRAPAECSTRERGSAGLTDIDFVMALSNGTYCAATTTQAFILRPESNSVLDISPFRRIDGIGSVGGTDCAFIHSQGLTLGLWSMAGTARYLTVSSLRNFGPLDVGGRGNLDGVDSQMPWLRVEASETGEAVVRHGTRDLRVGVPRDSRFVEATDDPFLISCDSGLLELVAVDRPARPGSSSRTWSLDLAGLYFRSVASAYFDSSKIYVLAEVESSQSPALSVSLEPTQRLYAWIEVDLAGKRPARSSVVMTLRVRGALTSAAWARGVTPARLLLVVDHRLARHRRGGSRTLLAGDFTCGIGGRWR